MPSDFHSIKRVKLFVAVYDDASLLPHFLRHYSAQGVTRFFIAVHPKLAAEVRRRSRGHSAAIVKDPDVAESVEGGTRAVTAMRLRHSGPREWVAIADLDEFQVHPGGMKRSVLLAKRAGANVVRGTLIDRVAVDGGLPDFDDETDLWSLYPARCRLTKRLQRGLDYKCALVKGRLPSANAHHRLVGEAAARRRVEIHHFKWNARAVERMESAIGRIKAAGLPWHVEYERVLEHVRRNGRIRWRQFV
jgi:hypothetical protein